MSWIIPLLVQKCNHITTCLSTSMWLCDAKLNMCQKYDKRTKIWFSFSIFYLEVFPAVHLSWIIIHLTYSTACASTSQKKKKVKGVFPKCSSEKIKQCDFRSSEADYNEGNPEWRSLCYFLLWSLRVIFLQNNFEKEIILLMFNRALTYTVQSARTGRLNCV